MREVILAVLGAKDAGKSTFVRCALDLKKPATSPSATKKVSLEGVVSVLRLLEVQINDISIDSDENVLWPQTSDGQSGGQSLSRVDGVLVLYDVMNQSSLTRVPSVLSESLLSLASLLTLWIDLMDPVRATRYFMAYPFLQNPPVEANDAFSPLDAFSRAAIPTILVSSKCDKPTDSWEVDIGKIQAFCQKFEGVELFQTSANSPETHKRCVSVILRHITTDRYGKPLVSFIVCRLFIYFSNLSGLFSNIVICMRYYFVRRKCEMHERL